MKAKTVVVIGGGLGGMCTAIRLAHQGFRVRLIEKNDRLGGRLNQIKEAGFTFDMGPSFFSMSYEFDRFFESIGRENPIQMEPLDPLYAVYFENRNKPFKIHKDLNKLAQEFSEIEPQFEEKAKRYLKTAKGIFHDTEYKIVKRNFSSKLQYLATLATVPLKYSPLLFRSFWKQLEKHFDSHEVKVIFSLVAFFLGSTPFDTPAVYKLLNYSELEHDGYWSVKGGMYEIVHCMQPILEEMGVEISLNAEIKQPIIEAGKLMGFRGRDGEEYRADIFVSNQDAAAFRGQVLGRNKFNTQKLDAMKWTLAPFTIYLGAKGQIPNLYHHNYFLGENFSDYAGKIFRQSISPQKPYYYVNVSSKTNPNCAPENCENLFFLCPVPDLRYKSNWDDREDLADRIIEDFSKRVNYDLAGNTLFKKIMDPLDWENKFNLYRGSGLGLAHDLNQVGALRPKNIDEDFRNLFYVGASTTPGTGLPMVVISSKLVQERIETRFKPSV